MNHTHIRSLDLNLLKVFEALLEEGGVSAAGHRLGLSQSAVSHALNRLRRQVGDPLFTRTAAGMQPTPRALELGPRWPRRWPSCRRALEPPQFDPAAARRFTLFASGYLCTVLAPDLLARLQAAAPRAELRVSPLGPGVVEALDHGRVDLAVGGFGQVPERYGKQALFEDQLVWVMRSDHPLAAGPLTLEGLAGASHLIVGTGEEPATGEALIDHGLERRVLLGGGEAFHAALAAKGLERRVQASVPGGDIALSIVARTEMIALLPSRLVPLTGRFRGRAAASGPGAGDVDGLAQGPGQPGQSLVPFAPGGKRAKPRR